MDIVIAQESAKSVTDRWPAECRDIAYQYWAFVAGRNAAKVAALLGERGWQVPERTVQYWASSGEWAKRASEDLGRIAPDIRQQTIAELIYGGLEAARGLRSVVLGEEAPDKVKVTAYVAMLDRAGFSPVGSNAPELPRVSVAAAAEDWRALSADERRERQRALLDGQRQQHQPKPRRKR